MKKLLIVVDYQNDFVSGSLGFLKATTLELPIKNRILEYRKNNNDILFTFDTHNEDYLNTIEGNILPIVHCIKGTFGHKLYGEIATLISNTDKIINKPTFGSDELYYYLKNNPYDEIEFCGVVSNICVISNAILAKTALSESKIIINTSCIASNDDDLNQKAIDVMKSLQLTII